MSTTQLEVVDQVHFKVGRLVLPRHWGLGEWEVSALTRPGVAKQLCLQVPSEFPSGRIPLYVCRCGDLQCGAVTVRVSEEGGLIRWAEFGREAPYAWEGESQELHQSEYMARTGPFEFERDAYRYALSPFL